MKKDWLDQVSTDAVRDFFTKNIVDENSYVGDVRFVENDTRNNVVLVFTRNPITKKLFTHFYDAFGVVYLDDEGMFTNKFKGRDLDNSLGAWYSFVADANDGVTIDGLTYREAFEKHHSNMINNHYNPARKALERQLAQLNGEYSDAQKALRDILGEDTISSEIVEL